jgi:methylmalonyl-CoA mutase C-terminal domain/subunit
VSEAGRPRRVLLAKTSFDGHWRGVMVVARALRDAGFEVVFLGQATGEEIAAAAEQESVDLVGLNVGGRIEVAERVVEALRRDHAALPILAGGTIPPWAAKRLAERGVEVFPPGSALSEIVAAARRLTASADA